jgi:hypothetical protein
MSLVFMEIGRSSPRHQELALIYAQSKSLQAYISEYYIVVVEFCHEMLRFTQRSVFRQLTTALGGDLIRKTQSDLDDWGGKIKDEMLLLIAKRTEDEAAENSRFRSMSKKFSKSMSHHNRLVMKLQILQGCSTHDHETTWKQIRKSGNTTTFTEAEDYKKWKGQPRSCTLLYYGKLGSGKSVVLSNMVDDLNLAVGQHRTSIAYFFVRQDLSDSLKARTIIGSLTRQLLESKDDWINADPATSGSLGVHEMFSLLAKTYTKQDKIHIVLDGLDLCAKEELADIVAFTIQLQERLWVLTCVSLRQEPDREPDRVYRGFRDLQISSLPDNNSDITSFVEDELQRCAMDGRLTLGNAALILTIRDALLMGSQGMFLWVVLQIKVLCSMETDKEIEEALEDLPTDLSETYSRILDKVQGRRKVHQDRILRLMTAAKLPLSTDEMQDALSVTPGQTDWTNRATINDIYSTLKTCGCLVQVDEEENTVRFVHRSVKDFFLRPRLHLQVDVPFDHSGHDTGITTEHCHRTMAEIIVTYLSYGVFDRRISTARVPVIEAGGTPSMTVKAVTDGSKKVQSFALKLLAHRNRLDFDLGKAVAENMAARNSRKVHEFPFLRYAQKWSVHHTCAIKSIAPGPVVMKFLPAILDESSREASSEIASETTTVTALVTAIKNDIQWLLELLAPIPEFVLDCKFSYYCHGELNIYTPEKLALCAGNERTIKTIRRRSLGTASRAATSAYAATVSLRPDYDKAPICYVINTGDESVVRRHLETYPLQRQHICLSGRNPIAFAVWCDKMDIAESLMRYAGIDLNTGYPGHTPIEEAIATRNFAALKLLLSSEWLLRGNDRRERWRSQAKAIGFEEAVELISKYKNIP